MSSLARQEEEKKAACLGDLPPIHPAQFSECLITTTQAPGIGEDRYQGVLKLSPGRVPATEVLPTVSHGHPVSCSHPSHSSTCPHSSACWVHPAALDSGGKGWEELVCPVGEGRPRTGWRHSGREGGRPFGGGGPVSTTNRRPPLCAGQGDLSPVGPDLQLLSASAPSYSKLSCLVCSFLEHISICSCVCLCL